MIEVRNMGAQGDVLFRRVDAIPQPAWRWLHEGKLIVAHSETGHHHVIESPGVELFTISDPFISYLKLEAPHADVVHEREYHTHRTLRLFGASDGRPAYYEVRRQREHSPEGFRPATD